MWKGAPSTLLLFSLERVLNSQWLSQGMSVAGHCFVFNDNVVELKEPWIRNRGEKREKRKKKNPNLISVLLFPSQAVCPWETRPLPYWFSVKVS